MKEFLAHSVQTADHELCKPQSPGHYPSERSDAQQCVCADRHFAVSSFCRSRSIGDLQPKSVGSVAGSAATLQRSVCIHLMNPVNGSEL